MKNKIYLYPIWVRIWHLINAILIILLTCSGLCLQYASETYTILSFDSAVKIHNVSGIILTANYLFFLFMNRFTSNGMYYQFHLKGILDRVTKQLKYYTIGIFKKEEPHFPISTERKFNPLQKLSYVFVMYIVIPVIIITGIMLFFPDLLLADVLGVTGVLHLTDLLHIALGFFSTIFMLVHIYFCTIGSTPTSNFKSMINGWHEAH